MPFFIIVALLISSVSYAAVFDPITPAPYVSPGKHLKQSAPYDPKKRTLYYSNPESLEASTARIDRLIEKSRASHKETMEANTITKQRVLSNRLRVERGLEPIDYSAPGYARDKKAPDYIPPHKRNRNPAN